MVLTIYYNIKFICNFTINLILIVQLIYNEIVIRLVIIDNIFI